MNPINHFLVAFLLNVFLFSHVLSIFTIFLFTIVFAVMIDLDLAVGLLLKKPKNHLRTWVQEPFGFFLLGIPVALILSSINSIYKINKRNV